MGPRLRQVGAQLPDAQETPAAASRPFGFLTVGVRKLTSAGRGLPGVNESLTRRLGVVREGDEMRAALVVVGLTAALLAPAGSALARPIEVHESGSVGSDGCGAYYDTGWYYYDPATGTWAVRAPYGGVDLADC